MSTTLGATAPLADVVGVEDVVVHSHTDLGWHCEIAGHAVLFGNAGDRARDADATAWQAREGDTDRRDRDCAQSREAAPVTGRAPTR